MRCLLFFTFLNFWANIAQTQETITIYFPEDMSGVVNLFSYYPQSQTYPLQQKQIVNGVASLTTTGLAPGVYSAYHSEFNDTYINFLIEEKEGHVEVYWNPKVRFTHFNNAPLNAAMLQMNGLYYEMDHKRQALRLTLDAFQDAEVKKTIKDSLYQVNQEINRLLQSTQQNQTVLDDYLLAIEYLDEDAKTETAFWETADLEKILLWSTPYQYHAMNSWKRLCEQLATDQSEVELLFLSGVIKHLGINEDFHLFLWDWLTNVYDKNRTNHWYLEGLKQLQDLPNVSSYLQQKIAQNIRRYAHLSLGEIIDLSFLEADSLLKEEDQKLALLFYSEGCSACVDALNQLSNATMQVIAVRVFSNDHSLIKEDDYPTVRFYHPEDPSIYEKYVIRGTPCFLRLNKKKGEWVIVEIQ